MNEKITLQELVELFARKCQWNEADAELFVKEFLALIEEALARDKYVKVKGPSARDKKETTFYSVG